MSAITSRSDLWPNEMTSAAKLSIGRHVLYPSSTLIGILADTRVRNVSACSTRSSSTDLRATFIWIQPKVDHACNQKRCSRRIVPINAFYCDDRPTQQLVGGGGSEAVALIHARCTVRKLSVCSSVRKCNELSPPRLLCLLLLDASRI